MPAIVRGLDFRSKTEADAESILHKLIRRKRIFCQQPKIQALVNASVKKLIQAPVQLLLFRGRGLPRKMTAWRLRLQDPESGVAPAQQNPTGILVGHETAAEKRRKVDPALLERMGPPPGAV
jgi:hypothetical protein